MKVRIGFVSNSSTTSFLIYGAIVDRKDCDNLKYKANGIESHYGEADDYYLGLSWDEVGLDETGRQFMERVEKEIEEVVGHPVECKTYAEAWYNG